MPGDDQWTFFTQDPRYRTRERVILAGFAILIALLVWQRQEIECRLLAWRLFSGVNEWGALFRLADKGPEAMEYYVHRIDSPDPEVRYKVLLTLKAMRRREALPYLRSRLDDPDLDVRVNTYDALAELGAREAIPSLIAALGDENHRLRRVAHRSLHMLTGESFDFDPNAEPAEQTEAVGRWKSWWASQGSPGKSASDG